MSATNRHRQDGKDTKRIPQDFYITPEPVVKLILDELDYILPKGTDWLDPCAGDGAIINADENFGNKYWFALEIRKEEGDTLKELYRQEKLVGYEIGDFLAKRSSDYTLPSWYSVILTNPPYKHALEFIKHSLEISQHVVMLLRLSFLESKKRKHWLNENMPDVYVLPQRPSFTGDGTDACAYAWMHWISGRKQSTGRIKLLNG